MPKVARREPKYMKKYIKELHKILSGASTDDIENLFDDLLTPMEEKMLAKRVQIAKMLLTGRKYDEIERELNVQRTTVARVRLNLTRSSSGTLEKTIVTKLPR